jgi:putative peptidoglycan binding protein/D-alanyl-D-alanine carboxypeptidase-like protein
MPVTTLVPIPAGINADVTAARQQTMLSLLGNPRAQYTSECQNPTNERIASLTVVETLDRLKVRGLRPAVDSLAKVLADVRDGVPDVYAVLGHQGMLCARLVRGSATSISNHSWGTAIDLTLDGVLDRRGDGLVQEGLTRIVPIFNRHGWFWGAGFRTEDAMHFECSDGLIRQWAEEGLLGAAPAVPVGVALLSLGDRGPDVAHVQAALNAKGARLLVDGDFGRNTQAAVMAFQGAHGLTPDGVVGPKTLAALCE